VAGISRTQIARTLKAGYAHGLLSQDTFQQRLDQVLNDALVEPARLIGDLNFRRTGSRWRSKIARILAREVVGRIVPARAAEPRPGVLLGLDWSGTQAEMLIGRDPDCDLTFADTAVSRRHAHLRFRDGRWILQDLESTNGTWVNGVRVGRCELRHGDELVIGELHLTID
jgi:FHA domain